MPIKIQKKKKDGNIHEVQEVKNDTPTQQTTDIQQQSPSAQQQANVDLWSFLAQMTQMMWQQNEMMKMMDERMKKLEEQNASTKTQTVEGEIVDADVQTVNVSEDNVASYNREDEEWYAEVINKVWKIMYITEQAPVMRGMPDAAPMMATVEERRRVWNQSVIDTKYFNSEDDAKAYIENLRQKGITLPGARIISCYI